MANSGTVTAGSAALASQYNNLRDDVLNISTGHTHSGSADAGAKIEGTALKSTGATAGYVLTAGVGGTATVWSASASSGALSLATASAAYGTAADGTGVSYTGGGTGSYSLAVGCGGTVLLTISGNNNYRAGARTYRTWNLGTGGVSYIATSDVSPAVAGTVISDNVGGAGFAAGTAFLVKENYGSGGVQNTKLRRFTSNLTNSWNTTISLGTTNDNLGEMVGPFGSNQGEGAPKWAQGPGIWYGGDYRTTTLAGIGFGTVSVHVINDVSGSAYSAPFGTASTSGYATTFATVFVPSVGTATSGTIHAWGRVRNSGNTGNEMRYCTYAVGSASITALSTAVSDLFFGTEGVSRPVAAQWDETRSQILLYAKTSSLGYSNQMAALDRTAGTVLFTSDDNAAQRSTLWYDNNYGMGFPNYEGAVEMQHDLTTGFFATSVSSRVVLSKWGTPGPAMTPMSPIWYGNDTTIYQPACLAGAGSATHAVYAGTTTIVSRSVTAGLAQVTAVGTASAAFREVTISMVKPLGGNASIKSVDVPGGYEIFAQSAALSYQLATADPGGGLAMVSHTYLVPGTSTMTVTVANPYGTGAYQFVQTGTATFQTAGGTAFILARTITMA